MGLFSVHGTFSTSHGVVWKKVSAGISPRAEQDEQYELSGE
jgi:hypothetical protein